MDVHKRQERWPAEVLSWVLRAKLPSGPPGELSPQLFAKLPSGVQPVLLGEARPLMRRCPPALRLRARPTHPLPLRLRELRLCPRARRIPGSPVFVLANPAVVLALRVVIRLPLEACVPAIALIFPVSTFCFKNIDYCNITQVFGVLISQLGGQSKPQRRAVSAI